MNKTFLLILIIGLVAVPGMLASIISTQKDNYMIGEVIIITVNSTGFSGINMDIVSSLRNMTYFNPNGNIRFIPSYPGNHMIRVYNASTTLEVKRINVRIPYSATISTSKINYVLGEPVQIFISSTSMEELTLEIDSEGKSYNFLGPI